MKDALFHRHSGNPVLTVDDVPYPVNSVFNAGATLVDGETLLLLRVEDRTGLSHFTVARSGDGFGGWRVESEPVLTPDPERFPEEQWGIEDPRITWAAEVSQWVVTYTSFSSAGPLVSLATTRDFRTFERYGAILPPENKDAALFPLSINGAWRLLHRPVPKMAGVGAHIWLTASPDLRHWGRHRLVLPARRGAWWDANKIGVSAPPLETPKGWLVLYHGVRETVSGSIYRQGLALLDREDPGRVLARSTEWVFGPQEPYERSGDVGNVVFCCGWTLAGGEVRMYYGAADTAICVATASLDELLAWLENHGDPDAGGGR